MGGYWRAPPERQALSNAIQRCHNPKNRKYAVYGARGITVFDGWRGVGGAARFLDHIGPKPHPSLTLDRIDNNRGYEPGNVRWTTESRNARNMRKTLMVKLWGVDVPLKDISETMGLDHTSMRHRVSRGMSWREAVLACDGKRRIPWRSIKVGETLEISGSELKNAYSSSVSAGRNLGRKFSCKKRGGSNGGFVILRIA